MKIGKLIFKLIALLTFIFSLIFIKNYPQYANILGLSIELLSITITLFFFFNSDRLINWEQQIKIAFNKISDLNEITKSAKRIHLSALDSFSKKFFITLHSIVCLYSFGILILFLGIASHLATKNDLFSSYFIRILYSFSFTHLLTLRADTRAYAYVLCLPYAIAKGLIKKRIGYELEILTLESFLRYMPYTVGGDFFRLIYSSIRWINTHLPIKRLLEVFTLPMLLVGTLLQLIAVLFPTN